MQHITCIRTADFNEIESSAILILTNGLILVSHGVINYNTYFISLDLAMGVLGGSNLDDIYGGKVCTF